jgi:hypothetical protein
MAGAWFPAEKNAERVQELDISCANLGWICEFAEISGAGFERIAYDLLYNRVGNRNGVSQSLKN